ncbi:MAG: hypothetical protein ACKV2T_35360 [Kofleriaceae bacterium]
MKLAESTRSRWVLALASIAFGATAIVAVSKTCTKTKAPVVATYAKTASTVQPWRACKERKRAKPAQKPVVQVTGSDYRDVLVAAKPAFDACTATEPSGVTYEIRMPIGGDGHVMSVEVRGANPDIRKVSMKVLKCLETAVSKLQFPPTGERTVVSTTVRTE